MEREKGEDAAARAAEPPRRAEAPYRALLQAVPEAVIVTDANGRTIEVSTRFLELHGCSASEEMVGRDFLDFVAPEEHERVAAVFQASLRGETVAAIEATFLRCDGSRFIGEAHGAIVRDSEGRPIAMVGTNRDVTEQKRAAAALRASETSYRQIFDAANDAIVVYDLATAEIVDVNRGVSELYGYTLDELRGRPAGSLSTGAEPFTQEAALRLFARAVAGEPVAFEWQVRSKAGQAIWIEVQLKRATIGGHERVLAVARDVSRRKKAEEALRLSELQYRSTLDSLGDAVHVVDENLRFVLFNRTFNDWLRTLGAAADPAGHTVFDRFPFLPERVRDEYRTVFETGRTLVTEETTKIGGREITTETRKIPVFESGRVVRIVTVVRDITDKRKLEQEFLKAQKLESIGLLAGGIAHDFNNLLAGIITNLAVATRDAAAGEEAPRALARAEKAAQRARALTERLLTFSSGGAPVRRAVGLAPLLRETAELALAGSNVRCDLRLQEGLWPAYADAAQVSQVVQNLLVNARQAMPRGGTVTVVAENFAVAPGAPLPVADGDYVRLTVRDEGVGIAPENLARIFDPYFTTKERGGGLGLAASYSIATKHGGCIDVHSELGVGTTFHVYLPAAKAGEVEAQAAPAAPPGGHRLLFMDDDNIIRRGALRLLRDCGYEAQGARDGAEALQLYARAREAGQPFDVVILDLTVLDGMGGEECLERLREADPAVRAVVCSGYSSESVLGDFRAHGFQGAIRKPFTAQELREVLGRVLAHRGQ